LKASWGPPAIVAADIYGGELFSQEIAKYAAGPA
jgi:hypothetical protein